MSQPLDHRRVRRRAARRTPDDVPTSPLAPARRRASAACCATSARPCGSAAVLVIADFWILGQLDRWTLGLCIALGVGLGLANHLATEHWLLKLISSGEQPTRNKMIGATLVRLGVLQWWQWVLP